MRKEQITVEMEVPCVHFVETSASLLQEMPSLIHRDYKVRMYNSQGHSTLYFDACQIVSTDLPSPIDSFNINMIM